jgi:hypothetical protein
VATEGVGVPKGQLAAEKALGLVDPESVELGGKVSLGEGTTVGQVGRDDAPEEKEAEAGQLARLGVMMRQKKKRQRQASRKTTPMSVSQSLFFAHRFFKLCGVIFSTAEIWCLWWKAFR